MEKVERIQYQAALAVTGAWQGSSRCKLYDELGWESLSERRWCRRILQVHKIVSNNTPSYLKDKLPRHRRPLYSQNNNKNNTFHRGSQVRKSVTSPPVSTFLTCQDTTPPQNVFGSRLARFARCTHMGVWGEA